MAFRTTPQLGPQIDEVVTGVPYWDSQLGLSIGDTEVDPSYRLGNKETGSDGHDYLWVKASADIAATPSTGTEVTVTEPGFMVAAGAGGYFTPPGVAVSEGQFLHVRKGAAGAP
ncbi:hypothetical protein [Devosia nitrariae]|uniref:Uncharacterized protein n=1 Tax=Devosia nitrariae TaxID=2071872 RepID=A0ABQ5W183_9HYPH|nr:hypothetical protein [Devosia nitrariae]GLQ53757.1 hypothetical protein GCM10010862_10160 [Devosia nitrariae]